MLNKWASIKYFNKDENWGDPNKIKMRLLYEMDKYRDFTGKPFIVYRAYSIDDLGSTHSHGMAVDGHTEGLSLLEQYLAAERFGFSGIGVYDKTIWNNPGLHLDIRINPGRWGCTWKMIDGIGQYYSKNGIRHKEQDYVRLDTKFIKSIL